MILFASYQEYMINSTRIKKNWEAEFTNITYEQAKEVEKDKNVKEISIVKKIGITEENFADNYNEMFKSTKKYDIRAYNENALKNAKIIIKQGRLPENSKEILISQSGTTETDNAINIEKKITELVLNSFAGLIAVISAVNIYNVISSSILLRKRDLAVLKSVGMKNK